jgi:NAD(P)-dependent dehydrogenase (short-subunit alcohol dehydrogenase family)
MTIVLVTGCTHGLGMQCVRALASRVSTGAAPSFILLACRNPASAAAVADSIAAETLYPRSSLIVLPEPLDLASLSSVRTYAAAVRTWLAGRELYSLVNNAGVGGSATLTLTADGFENIFQTNHLGHFLLTLLLLPARPSRIINVASEVHDAAANKLPLPEPSEHWPEESSSPEWERVLARGGVVGSESASTSGQRRYTRSKLLNVLFTHELAQQLAGAAHSAAVLAYNPGLMLETNFVSSLTGSWLVGLLAWLLMPAIRWLTPMGRFMQDASTSGTQLGELALPTPASAAWLQAPGSSAAATYYDKATATAPNAFTQGQRGLMQQQMVWAKSLAWARVTPEELAAAGLPLQPGGQ